MSDVMLMTGQDMRLAERLGLERQDRNARAGIREARKDGRTSHPERIHILGATAEIAFARRYGLEPDLTTDPRCNVPDFVVGGWRIDVKATDWPNGKMVCSTKKRVSDTDVYVLTVVQLQASTVEFVGYARSRDLICPAALSKIKGMPTYMLERHQLSSMESFDKGMARLVIQSW